MKKNIKKLAAILLAVVMTISALSLSAFAAEDVLTENGSVSKNVTVRTTGADPYKTYEYEDPYAVMNVVVTWGDLDFEYYFGEIWNPTTLQYDAAEGKTIGWNKDSTTVTVTNRSNIAVDVDVLFNKNTSNSAYRDVSGSFDKTSAILGSAIDGTAKSDDFTLSIAGIPNAASTSKTILGTIKVTISGRYSSGSITGGSLDGDDNDG